MCNQAMAEFKYKINAALSVVMRYKFGEQYGRITQDFYYSDLYLICLKYAVSETSEAINK